MGNNVKMGSILGGDNWEEKVAKGTAPRSPLIQMKVSEDLA